MQDPILSLHSPMIEKRARPAIFVFDETQPETTRRGGIVLPALPEEGGVGADRHDGGRVVARQHERAAPLHEAGKAAVARLGERLPPVLARGAETVDPGAFHHEVQPLELVPDPFRLRPALHVGAHGSLLRPREPSRTE